MEQIDLRGTPQRLHYNYYPNHLNHNHRHNNHHHHYRHHYHLQQRQQLPRAPSRRHPPFFIVFISIFELVAFVYYSLRTEEPISLVGPVPFDSKLIYNPYRRYEFWRYLTYMLIHAGYWHIIFNLLVQLAVGVPLEIVHQFNSVFIIYFGGILSGSLGNSIVDPTSYLVGCSSGCYALIAAHLSNLIINWKELKKPYLKLITLLLFVCTDFGIAIYERHYGRFGHYTYRTSYGGHLAGGISGLLLGLVFLKNFRAYHWEQAVSHYAIATYVTLTLMAIGFNILNKSYFPVPDYSELVWSLSPFRLDRE